MTAPSKMTKADLLEELKREKRAVDRLQKERTDFYESLKACEADLSNETTVARNLRGENSRFISRFGELKKGQVIVKIGAQTHYPKDFEAGNEFVRKLIDAGIWYFSVGEK